MPSSKDNNPRRNNIKTGRKYEQLAADFFINQNFQILATNYRTGKKEIDLIVQKDDLVIFVEVKASSSDKFGHPSERIDKKKIAHLTEAAHQFVIGNNLQKVDLRFDVITFLNGKLEHYPNAFEGAE